MASVGGPVRKNKTFFFTDYEGRRVREGITRVTNVPTALERIGDFSQSDPRTPPIDLFTQAPFPGNKIPANRLHPIGVAIAALYPLPNRAAPLANQGPLIAAGYDTTIPWVARDGRSGELATHGGLHDLGV